MPESPWEWSTTASGNANADTAIGMAEGMMPGLVNNGIRALMAALKKLIEDQGGKASTTGSSNAYALTTQADVNALADGVMVSFVANHTCTGAATLAVDGLAAKAIRKGADIALSSGDIVQNAHYVCQYDASANTAAGAWLLLNPTSVDFGGLAAETSPAADDELPIRDVSASTNDKLTLANLFKVITGLTAETAPAADDEIALYDLSAAAADKITLANLLKVVNALTAETAPAADDQLLLYDTSAGTADRVAAGLLNSFGLQLLHVRDEKASATDAGTFTSGAWQTRTLNTVKTNEITGASLATNQIVLPAGTYWVQARAPGYRVDAHQIRLRNITDTTTALVGTSENSGNPDFCSVASTISARLTIAAQKTFALEHRCSTTNATKGFGQAVGFGETEAYAEVAVWKIA